MALGGMDVDLVAREVVDGILTVHKALGPGLLESAYQAYLAHELRKRSQVVETEILLPVRYRDITINAGFRADMMINHCVLIENKAVQKLLPIHEAQLLNYLKLSDLRLGLLVNWNVRLIKHGIKRIANNL